MVCYAFLARSQSHDSKTSAACYLPWCFDFDSFAHKLFLESSLRTKFFFYSSAKKKKESSEPEHLTLQILALALFQLSQSA